MGGSANFKFHGSLNDFLTRLQKGTSVRYEFTGKPAVKDAIEAIGVPHPEIAVVEVNTVPVDFAYPLKDEDRVEVYPIGADRPVTELQLPDPICFVLDVHLGKLAKALRMLGFDTRYENNYGDVTIATLAMQEKRIVLTRDIGLLKHRVVKWGYWLRSQHLEEQLKEVIMRFKLLPKAKPFIRCLACNGEIMEVPKAAVADMLPPKTKLYFDEFYQCPSCQRVYWKGSHYERMQQFLEQLGL